MSQSSPKPRATMWVVIIVSIGILLAALLFVGKSMQRDFHLVKPVHARQIARLISEALERKNKG